MESKEFFSTTLLHDSVELSSRQSKGLRIALLLECQCGAQCGAELGMVRDVELHAVNLLDAREHHSTLWQAGEIANEHEVLDTGVEL